MGEVTDTTFRTIFEQSPISTQIFSPDGQTLKVNKAWEKLWGVRLEQLGAFNILKDEQLKKSGMMKYIKEGFSGKVVKVPPHHYEPRKAVGSSIAPTRWVQDYIYPIKDKKGRVIQVIMQHEDITELKESEERLRESEGKFRQLFDSNIIGVFIADFGGKFLDGNDAFLRIIGYTREELSQGMIYRDNLTPPEFLHLSQDAIKALKKTGSSQTFEKEYIHKSGRGVPILAAVARLGNSESCIGFVVDITERKKLERQKDEFISIASHELKTPVTTLKSYTQILQHLFNDPKKARFSPAVSSSYLVKMNSQIDRLTALINDLLDVSRISAGKLELQKEKFVLNEVVSEVVEDMQQTDSQHKIVLEGDNNRQVYADKYRISQVLINLISNAIKYSPRSNKVVVKILSNGQKVGVVVQDFGIGISKRDQNQIFDRFFQAKNRIRQSYSGLGLGLYISSEIIRRHKGRIWVESEKGKGSTFSFDLPVADSAAVGIGVG